MVFDEILDGCPHLPEGFLIGFALYMTTLEGWAGSKVSALFAGLNDDGELILFGMWHLNIPVMINMTELYYRTKSK